MDALRIAGPSVTPCAWGTDSPPVLGHHDYLPAPAAETSTFGRQPLTFRTPAGVSPPERPALRLSWGLAPASRTAW